VSLTATIFRFEVQLSDVDRGVYEALTFRVAQHPSESDEYLVTRVLAYCLEYADGIAFSPGLSEPDEPAISIRDLTGTVLSWIEIGNPSVERLHRASKASPRVAVYTFRDPRRLAESLGPERIHRKEALELYAVDQALVAWIAERLDRRMVMTLTVTDRHLIVSIGSGSAEGAVDRIVLGADQRRA
jgi:uncharacterized protein YaeQ